MVFNHFTSWKKEDIKFDSCYEAMWEASNYWLNKQNNSSQIKHSSDQVFQSIQSILSAFGHKFDLTVLSAEIQKATYYSELLKEYIFEEIRLNEYPEKPSRKNCMLLVPAEVGVCEYAQICLLIFPIKLSWK